MIVVCGSETKFYYFHNNLLNYRYGFTTNKLICLGYLQKYKPNTPAILNDKFILDKEAKYEIDIAGKRFTARAHLHAPLFPNQNLGSYSRYRPTVAISKTISAQRTE